MFKIIIFAIIAGTNVCTTQQIPTPNIIYNIQSRMDGGFIKPYGNGVMCDSLDWVGFSYFSPSPLQNEFQWQFVPMNNETGTYAIHSLKTIEDGFLPNELTFDDYLSDCGHPYREVRLIPHATAGSFIIQDVTSGKCLYSYGSEVGIVIWRGDPYTQYWEFVEVEVA